MRQRLTTWYTLAVIVFVLSALAVFGLSASRPGAGEAAEEAAAGPDREALSEAPSAAIVGMTGSFRFDPELITITAGETVLWRNTSPQMHTVTADPALASDPAHVQLPEGARPFNSGEIEPEETFRHTFTVPGRYVYFCIPHERMGMIGAVEVEPAE